MERLRGQGFQIEAYNSAELAADIEDLRTALRIPKWNLLGESYGTHLALVAMRLYPAGVRSVVLDSVASPGFDNRAIARWSLADAMHLLFSRHPGLDQDFETARAILAAKPLRVTGNRHGTSYDFPLNPQSIFTLLYMAFMETEAIPLMPDAIRGLPSGELREGWHKTAFTHAFIARNLVNNTVHAIWSCNDSASLPGYRALCESAGLQQQLDWPRSPSSNPTLLLAGEYDPATPPAGARHAAKTLTNHQLLILKNYGHMVTGFGSCPPTQILRFLDNKPGQAPACAVAEQFDAEFFSR